MVHKLIVLSGLFMSASCMVLHQAPLPLYLPIQYEEPAPNYNFAYEVNDAHTGDYKRQQESRIGDTVLGAYSLLQPDGLTRTVEYRADDHSGFNAVVNNVGTQNVQAERRDERREENEDASSSRQSGRQSNGRSQPEPQQWQTNEQPASPAPLTISHTSLIHQSISNGRNSWV